MCEKENQKSSKDHMQNLLWDYVTNRGPVLLIMARSGTKLLILLYLIYLFISFINQSIHLFIHLLLI